jgi:hypothetical protein
MRQFTARVFDPAAVVVEDDPILDNVAKHERAQWPLPVGIASSQRLAG